MKGKKERKKPEQLHGIVIKERCSGQIKITGNGPVSSYTLYLDIGWNVVTMREW